MPENETLKLEATLGCLAWFEERTARLYDLLASRISDRPISHLLRVLHYQSLSHRDIILFVMGILGMSEAIGGRGICSPFISPVAEITEELIEELEKNGTELRPQELHKIFRKLEFIESAAGEETYVKILTPLVKAIIDTTKEEWKRRAVSYLLEEIIREEKFHESIVAEILSRAVGNGKPK